MESATPTAARNAGSTVVESVRGDLNAAIRPMVVNNEPIIGKKGIIKPETR